MKVQPTETPDRHATSFYACSSCTRRFVTSGDVSAGEIICVCGGTLQPSALARGVYELKSSVPEDARATIPSSARRAADIPEERDLGYGPSHGLAPGHEGPTGPGDAPAK